MKSLLFQASSGPISAREAPLSAGEEAWHLSGGLNSSTVTRRVVWHWWQVIWARSAQSWNALGLSCGVSPGNPGRTVSLTQSHEDMGHALALEFYLLFSTAVNLLLTVFFEGWITCFGNLEEVVLLSLLYPTPAMIHVCYTPSTPRGRYLVFEVDTNT